MHTHIHTYIHAITTYKHTHTYIHIHRKSDWQSMTPKCTLCVQGGARTTTTCVGAGPSGISGNSGRQAMDSLPHSLNNRTQAHRHTHVLTTHAHTGPSHRPTHPLSPAHPETAFIHMDSCHANINVCQTPQQGLVCVARWHAMGTTASKTGAARRHPGPGNVSSTSTLPASTPPATDLGCLCVPPLWCLFCACVSVVCGV